MRNKLNILFIVVLFHSVFAHAQTTVSLGFKGGLNFSKWKYEKNEQPKQEFSHGYLGAIPVEIMFGEHWGLQTEPTYIQKTDVTMYSAWGMIHPHAYTSYTIRSTLDYVELPLMAKMVRGNKLKFSVVAGGFMSYLMAGKRVLSSSDFKTINDTYDMDSFHRFQAGISAGAGLKIPVSAFFITVDVRYSYGLTNMVSSASTVRHTQEMSATAGLLFPLRRKSSGL